MSKQHTTIAVTITLTVHSKRDFRMKAFQRAYEDGLSVKEAREYKNPRKKSLADCAVMIFDPGESPSGCDILDGSAEELPGL